MLSMNFSSGTKTILPFSLVYGFWIRTAEEDYLLIFVAITFVVWIVLPKSDVLYEEFYYSFGLYVVFELYYTV
jgi:hypothetical protein